MAFSMFSVPPSPIAVDFGTSSVKLLQIGKGERHSLIAAAELSVPDDKRGDPTALFEFYAQELPKVLAAGKFKGKRVVVAIPSGLTLIQHMQVNTIEGTSRDELIKGQLQMQMGYSGQAIDNVVVRSIDVATPTHKGELICFAVGRDMVMRYVDLFKRSRMAVVGIHTEMVAMVRAFDHLHRRESDDTTTTLYVDLGWGGTRAAVTHGDKLVFARYIGIGGKHFDQQIAKTLHCEQGMAKNYRLELPAKSQQNPVLQGLGGAAQGSAILASALQASEDAVAASKRNLDVCVEERRSDELPPELTSTAGDPQMPRIANKVNFSELLETIVDELSMCLRYHTGLFPDRPIDRVIFLGGEARQPWLCQHIVKALDFPAQMGNPLARLDRDPKTPTPGLSLEGPQPGWTVPCGLCLAPTDL
jgi:type IV pilus assembly protein PilM